MTYIEEIADLRKQIKTLAVLLEQERNRSYSLALVKIGDRLSKLEKRYENQAVEIKRIQNYLKKDRDGRDNERQLKM